MPSPSLSLPPPSPTLPPLTAPPPPPTPPPRARACRGNAVAGGDSSAVASQLVSINKIYANYVSFAAVTASGAVVTWGFAPYGKPAGARRGVLVGGRAQQLLLLLRCCCCRLAPACCIRALTRLTPSLCATAAARDIQHSSTNISSSSTRLTPTPPTPPPLAHQAATALPLRPRSPAASPASLAPQLHSLPSARMARPWHGVQIRTAGCLAPPRPCWPATWLPSSARRAMTQQRAPPSRPTRAWSHGAGRPMVRARGGGGWGREGGGGGTHGDHALLSRLSSLRAGRQA